MAKETNYKQHARETLKDRARARESERARKKDGRVKETS